MDNTFKQRKARLTIFQNLRKTKAQVRSKEIPDNIFKRCDHCGEHISYIELDENENVCPKCAHPFRLTARQRIAMLVDKKSFKELDVKAKTVNEDVFVGYDEKLKVARDTTGLSEAVICGLAKIDGLPFVLAVMDSHFMMGSMGSVVGDKITRAIETSTRKKLPLIICSTSGGARMQEGIVSLMQMAKTSAALKRHDEAGLLYVSVLTHPTTGGVSASFAMLGDIIISEPYALIGFAGKRVIEKTINEVLPQEFQTAEFLLEKGFVDRIVERKELRNALSSILKMHGGNYQWI